MGKNLIYVPECHSTNDLAVQIAQQPSAFEGTVVITDKQIKGRGQHNNQWLTEPSLNLTFSLILRPSFITPRDQFYLTRVISLAVHDLLVAAIDGPVFIKWPNDLMVSNQKICGILIENQLRGEEIVHSIAGIGLNVNQDNFPHVTATSLARLTSKKFELPVLLEQLLENIEARYLQLRNKKLYELEKDYRDVMYWRDEIHTFSSQGVTIQGTIKGVDAYGKLLINSGGEERSFDNKEITYVA